MKLIAAVAASAMLLMGQGDQSALHSVTAVRHWSLKGVTRVAVEVSGPFEYRTDRLHNPDRVYFDIRNSRLRIPPKLYYTETVGDDLLDKIRVAETTPGTTRVVLDLAENVAATTTTLTNPDRLVIELRTTAFNPLRTEGPSTASAHPATPPAPVLPPAPTVSSSRPPTSPTPLPSPASAVSSGHSATTSSPVLPPPSTASPAHSSTTSSPVQSPPAPTVSSGHPATTPAPVPLPPLASATATVKPAVAKVATSDSKASGLAVETSKPLAPAPGPAAEEFHPAVGDPGPDEVAKAAHLTSAGTSSLIRTLGLKINRVVIDPGHGGHDQGTEGPKGLLEKDLVLDVALRVGKLVQDGLGAEVIYTRSDDTFVPLEGRTALANEKKADLFLSIHANSSSYPNISGVETYYLNINGTKDAMAVASRENGPTQNSIFDLQDLVKKIALHDKSEESHEFAKRIEAALFTFNEKNFPGTKDRGVKTAPFIVLIGANMPSVLTEIGFVTNSKEEALLKRSEYRQKLAEALYKGIEKYTESLAHFQAAVKQ